MTVPDICEATNRALSSDSPSLKLEARLLQACTRVLWGVPNPDDALAEAERYRTAVHEAGHAILAWAGGFEVPRITVRPYQQALGITQWQRPEGFPTRSRESLLRQITMSLGGALAEQVVLGKNHDGNSSDLEAASRTIMRMQDLGLTCLGWGLIMERKEWSEQRKREAELEGHQILADSTQKGLEILTQVKPLLQDFAHDLLAQRELAGADLAAWQKKIEASLPPNFTNVAPDWSLVSGETMGQQRTPTLQTDQNLPK